MLFPTVAFAVFFVIVFAANWLLRPHYGRWRLFMIGASLYFYGYWDYRFVGLIVASIVINWLFAHAVSASLTGDDEKTEATKWLLRAAVATNLGILGFFKYYGFFTTSAIDLAGRFGIELNPTLLDVVLPVGISFFTFQAMSYVIDVGRGQLERLSLLDFALYLSFFPQLVAGPIVRASEFAPQLRVRPDPRHVRAPEAFRLIFQGLFKKVVISSYLATNVVDPVFALPDQHSAWENLVAVYAYAIQIYADFSGYTDIAIGCALLLGFRFPQNFDAPYRALSIQDFWRRWHMTLSRWLRDYLYIPLGGNRGSTLFTYRNLFLTMLLGGLWHGAAWTFVIWGAIHGGALAAERFIRERWQPIGLPRPVVGALQWVLTFHIVGLAWIFFRAETFGGAMDMLGRIVSLAEGPSPIVTTLVLVTIVAMLASQWVPQRLVHRADETFAATPLALHAAALAGGLLLIDVLGPEGVAPFIYFQF
ncbi:MAG TPA: MBOAT family protein [Acidimicrobiales bacterium]|nr:MBOAT family protein [Acidimicrobiales bacterium]